MLGDLVNVALPVLVVFFVVVGILLVIALRDFIVWMIGPRPKRQYVTHKDVVSSKSQPHVEHLTMQRKI